MDHPTANAPAAASASEGLLPFLHDAVLTLCAPSLAISARTGSSTGVPPVSTTVTAGRRPS